MDIIKSGNCGISCILYSPVDEEHSDIEAKSMYEYIPKDAEYSTVYQGKNICYKILICETESETYYTSFGKSKFRP